MIHKADRSRILSLCSTIRTAIKRNLHLGQNRNSFWEPDAKGGYSTGLNLSKHALVKDGLRRLPGELSKYKDEVMTKLACDSYAPFIQHGDYEIVWKFDKKDETDKWVVTADSDHNEGKSYAQFLLGANQKGVFHGMLNTEVPKDGVIKRAGYCNIKSPRNLISFSRQRPYGWSLFSHLLMRVRGDGRTYHIVLHMDRFFDLQWHDVYNYALFTRGGPYWQVAKIPFSKFYLGGKGRIQDKQELVQLNQISHMSISVADAVPGSFRLEIDYIGLLVDDSHQGNLEYEMYETAPYAIY